MDGYSLPVEGNANFFLAKTLMGVGILSRKVGKAQRECKVFFTRKRKRICVALSPERA